MGRRNAAEDLPGLQARRLLLLGGLGRISHAASVVETRRSDSGKALSFATSIVASGHASLPAHITPADRAPIQYEAAVQALQVCQTIDEARYFDNKAEALAAWAKIYGDDRAATEARRLKLHAYRRIGILAEQLRPQGAGRKGPPSLLREIGFTDHNAHSAIKVARMPVVAFEREVKAPRPRSPGQLVQDDLRRNPKAARLAARFGVLLSTLRKGHFDELVDSMDEADLKGCKARITELSLLVAQLKAQVDRRMSSPEKG